MKSRRRLRRFFSSQQLPLPGHSLNLSKDETHHLRDILRIREGDRCLVTDGSGQEAEAEICAFLRDGRAQLAVRRMVGRNKDNEHKIHLRMAQALPKQGKLDFLIEKAQELGVQEFWPIETDHSVVRLTQEHRLKTADRWRKKAIAATKQSGSLQLMQIQDVQPFQKALESVPAKDKITVLDPDPDARPFADWVEELKSEKFPFALTVFLGPEGGFSEREIEHARLLREKGRPIEFVSLGNSILRLETAFIGVVSTLRLLFL